MSRSVETVLGAKVIYFNAGEDRSLDGFSSYSDDLIDAIQDDLQCKYPSLNAVEEFLHYPYRETKVILQNAFVRITISEYLGCGAICIFVDNRAAYVNYYPELAEHWLQQNFSNMAEIIKQHVGPLRRLGTFSNGEAMFEKENE